jgi:hypothetical protein
MKKLMIKFRRIENFRWKVSFSRFDWKGEKKMKKIFIGLMVLILSIAFFACGNPAGGEKDPPKATVTSVTVSPPTQTVEKSGTYQFSTIVEGENNPAQTVMWNIEADSAKNAATTIVNGLLTVATDEINDTFTIRATSTVDTTKSGTAIVNIVAAGTPIVYSVTISPSTPVVVIGGNTQLSAAVIGKNDPAQTVTWSIETDDTNAGTTVDANGKLTVAAEETLRTLTVKATSTEDAEKSGTVIVSIYPEDELPTVTSVTVNPSNQNVARGGNYTFEAEVEGENNPILTVDWSIATGDINAGTTIDEDTGKLTIALAEELDELTIRATSTVNAEEYGEAIVTITGLLVQSVTITPQSQSVARGNDFTFEAEVSGKNTEDETVTWSIVETTKNTGTTIDEDTGTLTVAVREELDELTVRAESTTDNTKFDDAIVTVTGALVQSVTVHFGKENVGKGNSVSFHASVEGKNDPSQNVEWEIVESVNAETAINDCINPFTGELVPLTKMLTVAKEESRGSITVKATSTVDPTISDTTVFNVVENLWGSWVRKETPVTLDLSVVDDIAIAELGGTPAESDYHADIRYKFRGEAGKKYKYTFMAATDNPGDMVIKYYGSGISGDTSQYNKTFSLTTETQVFEFEGIALPSTLAGDGVINFFCADKAGGGKYFVEVISIEPIEEANTTIDAIWRGTYGSGTGDSFTVYENSATLIVEAIPYQYSDLSIENGGSITVDGKPAGEWVYILSDGEEIGFFAVVTEGQPETYVGFGKTGANNLINTMENLGASFIPEPNTSGFSDDMWFWGIK